MQNSKLYYTLQNLTRLEQNRFRKFLISPYFNSDQALVDLFELLIREINQEEKIELEKEAIWSRLGLEREYDDVRFRRYCTDLLKLVEDFLVQETFQGAPLARINFLVEVIGKRKLNKLFNSTFKNANLHLEKQEHRNSQFFFSKYEFIRRYSDTPQAGLDRSMKSNIEEMVQNLDIFYIAEKLRLFNDINSRRKLVSHDYNFLFMEEIEKHLDTYNYESIPAISLYHQIYLISKDPENEDYYYKLKKLLADHGLTFPQTEAIELYTSAINYCINKVNKGNQKFAHELFDLYQDLVEKEIIFIDGEISPWTFQNIVITALRLGKFEWTEAFINNYQEKIPEKYRENAVSFNLGTLYFYQKKYDKVIAQLQTVEYEDLSYNVNSKALLLATYYEMEEIEPLYSLFESFRVYLNRRKDIPERLNRPYKNLIKFTKKLTRITPGDQKSLQKLKEEVQATRNIASLGWLKEKIAELE